MKRSAERASSTPGPAVKRTFTFKFRVTAEERRIIQERACGFSSPADYARRTLLAGWSLPLERTIRVTDALIPLQAVIDRAAEHGYANEAETASAALRRILLAVS